MTLDELTKLAAQAVVVSLLVIGMALGMILDRM